MNKTSICMPHTTSIQNARSSVLIGIAGGSGSGKTTFVGELRQRLGKELCSVLSQDAYYKDQRRNFNGDGSINFDHPRSMDLRLMAFHLDLLKEGRAVAVPNYCFRSHRRLDSVTRQQASGVILVEGTLVLYEEALRRQLNMAVYIDTPENVRLERRIQRDTQNRGRTVAGCQKQFFTSVKPMHDEFIEPSREYADIVYPGTGSFMPLILECTKRLSL